MNLENYWKRVKEADPTRLIDYLAKKIPDVPLTPEMKLFGAIFGGGYCQSKSPLVETYISLKEPEGELGDYETACMDWVTRLLQDAIGHDTAMIREPILEILETLTQREKRVLVLRNGFEGRSLTLEGVGKELNVTRERIRQIESKALRKLKHPSSTRRLRDLWPGDSLRNRVFQAYRNKGEVPALFLFWMDDRQELRLMRRHLANIEAEVKKVVGLDSWGIDKAVSQIRVEVTDLRRTIAYLKFLVKEEYQKPIDELGWSTRTVRALMRYFGRAPEVPTVGEVAVLSDDKLLSVRNFGVKCLSEVRGTLESPFV